MANRTKVGALPVGFNGKILGVPFKILYQYDIYNQISAIVVDKNTEAAIVVFTGIGNYKEKAATFLYYILANTKLQLNERDIKDSQVAKMTADFSKQMEKEVQDFNKGKTKTTRIDNAKDFLNKLSPRTKEIFEKRLKNKPMATKKKVVKKTARFKKGSLEAKKYMASIRKKKTPSKAAKVVKKQTGAKSNKAKDKLFHAQAPGKRNTGWGTTYYESRQNRSDVDRKSKAKGGTLLGVGSATSDNAKQLILNSIDATGYGENPQGASEKIRFVEKVFLSEYGWAVSRLGKQKAIQEWLMGLPSVINLPFYNYDILNLAKQWGTLKHNATERQEDKILSNYWKLMASQMLQMFNKRKLNKKFY